MMIKSNKYLSRDLYLEISKAKRKKKDRKLCL